MTGRKPIRQCGDSPSRSTGGLTLDEHLLPQTLKAAGCQTFQTGKWHLGLERVAPHPHRRGFDHAYGHPGPGVDYFPHIGHDGLDWPRNGKVVREESYSTELITQEAVKLLKERDKAKPMLLYIAFNAPHKPLQSTDKYLDRYASVTISNEKTNLIKEKPEVAKGLTARLRAVPRPPSVSQGVPPAGGREGGREGGGGKGAKRGKKVRGPGGRNTQSGWPEEKREPWTEAAIRD